MCIRLTNKILAVMQGLHPLFLLPPPGLSGVPVSSWLFVKARKVFCCCYRRLLILRAKPFGVSTTGRLLQYKAEITPVQSRDYSSTKPRLLQYFTVVLSRLRRALCLSPVFDVWVDDVVGREQAPDMQTKRAKNIRKIMVMLSDAFRPLGCNVDSFTSPRC